MRASDEARHAQRRCLIRAAGYLLPGGRYEAVEAILTRVAAESEGFTTLEPEAAAKVHAVRARRVHAPRGRPGRRDRVPAEQVASGRSAAGGRRAHRLRDAREPRGDLGRQRASSTRPRKGLRQALADAERLELQHNRVWALLNLGTVLTASGLDEARRAENTVLEFARKQGDQRLEGAALLYLSTISVPRRRPARLRATARAWPPRSCPSPAPARGAWLRSRAPSLAGGRVKEALQHARMGNELLATLGHVEDYRVPGAPRAPRGARGRGRGSSRRAPPCAPRTSASWRARRRSRTPTGAPPS